MFNLMFFKLMFLIKIININSICVILYQCFLINYNLKKGLSLLCFDYYKAKHIEVIKGQVI